MGGGGRGNQRRYGVLKNALEQEMWAGGRGRGGGGVGVDDFIAHEGRRFPGSNFLNWPWGKSLYQLNLFTM